MIIFLTGVWLVIKKVALFAFDVVKYLVRVVREIVNVPFRG